MTDHRAATDQTSKTPADTTGGAGRVPLDKGGIAADKTTNATGADASSALLDGTLDPAYVKMMQGNKAAAGDSTNKPANTNPADTTARATTTAAGDKLQQNGILTNLSVHYHEPGGTSPSDKAPAVRAGAKADSVAANDATPEVKAKAQRLAYLQAMVGNFLPTIMAPANGTADASLQKQIVDKQNAVKQEATRGEFGPATREAYGQYVDWLEKTSLPATTRDLKMLKLPLDEPGANGIKAPPADLQINKNDVPDDAQLHRLDDAVRWALNGDSRVQIATKDLLKQVDDQYIATVKKLGLPQGWIEDVNRDHDRWRQSAGSLINGALTARSNIELLDEVNKAGGGSKVEDLLPPSMTVQRDPRGKIQNIHLDLPQGWDLTDSGNKQKAEQLFSLVEQTNALVSPTVPQLRTITGHPERALNWGDTEVRGMKGRFDSHDNFLGLADKDSPAKPGEHLADVNLVESRFNVEEKNGKVIVHQHVQAQDVPWWGYQNLIGVKDVGNKLDITRTFNPDDSVVIRTASGYEVKRAQDLSSYKNWQQAKYYGEKGLMGALDVGMIVSGAIEVGAAYKAARVAEVGVAGLDILGRGAAKNVLEREGAAFSGRALTMQAGKGVMRTTVGVAGLLNNAGARESDFGQTVNTARSIYFLADASIGLGQGGVRGVKSLLGRAPEAGLGAGKVTLAGLTAGSKTENFYRLTHGVFKVSEYGFMPLVADDLTKGIQRTYNDKNKHVVRAAEIVHNDMPTGDGQPDKKP